MSIPISAVSSPLVPVTVIGGYLGAGKTTLVNRLLTADHGRRLAVLVNDFGDINIDVDLIAAHSGETVSLTNGCVCCSINDSLGAAIDSVLALEPRPDQIVIEASGVADPAKVATYGQGWPGCQLDAVVVLADVETIRERSADPFVGELVTRQLSAGDLVLLTKTDLVDADAARTTSRWVAHRAGNGVPVVLCDRDTMDVAAILEVEPPVRGRSEGPQGPRVPDAEALFETATVDLTEPISRSDLEGLLEAWPDQVVRVKGVVALEDGRIVIAQRVGRRWSLEPAPANAEANGRLALIVLARSIDMARLGSRLGYRLRPNDVARRNSTDGARTPTA